MNIRVPTKKVIASLEKKLADIKKNFASFEEWQAKEEEWQKILWQKVVSDPKLVPEISAPVYNQTKVSGTYTIPKEMLRTRPKMPERDFDGQRNIPEIEQAIRLLKMTDDETVSASTFKSISKYL